MKKKEKPLNEKISMKVNKIHVHIIEDLKTRTFVTKVIFLFFLSLYFLLGFCLVKDNSGMNNAYDVFFGADNMRVFSDLTNISGDHYRIKVHPLFLLLAQPFIQLIRGIILNLNIAVLIAESLMAAGMVALQYNIVHMVTGNQFVSALSSCVLGFSYSCLVFAAVPETFIFSGCILSAFWAFVIHLVCEKTGELEKWDHITLVLFGVACFGITITNFASYLFGIAYLYVEKRKTEKEFLRKSISIIKESLILTVFAAFYQKLVWKSAPLFWNSLYDAFFNRENFEEYLYTDISFSLTKLLAFIRQFFIYPLTAPRIYKAGSWGLLFDHSASCMMIITLVIIAAGYIITTISKKDKSNCRYSVIIIFMEITYLFNMILHFVYGSGEAFIYSPHYLFLLISFVFIQVGVMKNNRIKKIALWSSIAYLMFMICNNMYRYYQMIVAITLYCERNSSIYSVLHTGLSALWVVLMFTVLAVVLRKIKFFLIGNGVFTAKKIIVTYVSVTYIVCTLIMLCYDIL